MKKITIIFLIIFIIFGMKVNVNAEENLNEKATENEKKASVEISIEGPSSIEIGEKNVTLILKLGAFTEVEENKTLGYDTTLDYNSNLVKAVTVEGLNGWSASYSEEKKILIGETDYPKANTQIAKITYQLNDTLKEETKLEMLFSKFNITDDKLLDQTTDLNKTITVKKTEIAQAQQETKDEKQTIQGSQNQQKEQKLENEIQDKNKVKDTDNTIIKTSTLPKTGIKAILIPIIIFISIMSIVFIIKSKSIKLK